MRVNKKYVIASIVFFVIEAFIALFVRDAFIRPFVGDVLVVILVYCLIRAVIVKPIRYLPVYIFLFAAGVEVLQYFKIIELLNLQDYALAHMVLGTTFDMKDIVCYLVGGLILVGWENMNK